ncbi:putative enzyme with nucleoside triphosphate hydrolase domain [Nitrospira japonica]|uniref:PhoH-like protein n=1 Tax=Nitrospira japonica TaxID=1325564 RepID=A0A1W1I1M5_9BACT|nr:putative enzyme with nucleoside triphosphate hydrolase domain [Nitrospira japonica]
MKKLKLREGTNTAVLFGHHDRHLKLIEDDLGVRLSARGEELTVDGSPDATRHAERVLTELAALASEGMVLQPEDIAHALSALKQSPDAPLKELLSTATTIVTKKRFVAPKTPTQKSYIEAIETHDIVIGIGPAGTGKTYLAMAMAVSALMKRQVSRIILARPAVEAGEKLGFLPGDMYAKVNPYLRPLYDALFDMMDMERATRAIERGDIEIAPLAFMRGRTLNDSFVILDEAQNATAEQMKMFLTRLGFSSKAVVTGDITQIDLPPERVSGLIEVRDILSEVEGIRFIYFDERDVVRHKLVQDIIKAYDQHQHQEGIQDPTASPQGRRPPPSSHPRSSPPPTTQPSPKSSVGQPH